MRIIVFHNEKNMDEFIGKHLIRFIQEHENPVIGFATGSTPLGLYQYLVQEYQQGHVDFSHIQAFNLDEYVGIDRSHPRSFASAMRRDLFHHINIPEDHIHSLDGNAENMKEECLKYDQLIEQNPIDIQILGIGMDGHIAYNEPGSPFDGPSHVVDLQKESIESSLDYGFKHISEVPVQGVTQGIGTIMKAKQLIMIAKGSKKAQLVDRMINGSVDESFPSSIIQKHSNVIVVLDEDAAQLLKEEDYERY